MTRHLTKRVEKEGQQFVKVPFSRSVKLCSAGVGGGVVSGKRDNKKRTIGT